MIIRDMTLDDKEIFLKMSADFYTSDAALHDFDRETQEKNLAGAIAGSPYVRCLMLEDQDGAAGYIIIAHSWSTEAGGPMIILEELYLIPEARGKGYAGEFFRWFFEEYRDRAAGYRLEVAPKNSDVIPLYEKFGYENLEYIQLMKSL